MKKIVLSFILLVAIGINLMAQTATEKKLIAFMQVLQSKDIASIKSGITDLRSNMKDIDKEGQQLAKAFLEIGNAIIAEKENNKKKVEESYKNAFWLAPDYSKLFVPFVSEYQQKELMNNVTIPLQTKLKTSEGKNITLAELVKGKKAILIDFWASWCGPCMGLMDELNNKGKILSPQNVAVVGMNTENSAEKAEKVKNDKGMTIPWLIEPENRIFSNMLKINSIPRMILISPEGKVLYNGHPSSPELETALKKVGAQLTHK